MDDHQQKDKMRGNESLRLQNSCFVLFIDTLVSNHTPYSKMAAILVFFCLLAN